MLDIARAWPLAIVSNKAGPFLRREVEHHVERPCGRFGWNRRFGTIVGAGDCVSGKPHPAPIWHALATIGVQAGPSV